MPQMPSSTFNRMPHAPRMANPQKSHAFTEFPREKFSKARTNLVWTTGRLKQPELFDMASSATFEKASPCSLLSAALEKTLPCASMAYSNAFSQKDFSLHPLTHFMNCL